MSIYKRIFKDSSSVFIAQIVSFITSLLIGIIIARNFGPEGKGALRLLTLVPVMIAGFGTLGVEVASIYYIGNKRHDIRLITSNSIFLALSISILVLIIYPFFIPKFFNLLKVEVSYRVKLSTYFLVPFSLFGAYFFSFLVGLKRIITRSVIDIIRSILLLILVAIFAQVSLLSVLAVNILIPLVPIIASIFVLKGVISFRPFYKREVFNSMFLFGLKGYLGSVAHYFNLRLDFFLVAFFLTPREVGLYSVAVGITELMWYIPVAISTVLFPTIASTTKEVSKPIAFNTARRMVIPFLLMGLCLLFFGKFIIHILYGEVFTPAFPALILLLPGVFAIAVYGPMADYVSGIGKIEYNSFASLCSLALTIVLDIILIPSLGISGAALASSCAYIVGVLVSWYYYRKF